MQVVPAYSAAFHLLPDLLWIGNSISVHQDMNRMMNIPQATSDAVSACIHLCNLKSAIELLEQGLGTSFQQLLQLKTTADAIPVHDATRLELLSMELYSGMSKDPQRTSTERSTLITKIRQLPGLENFLLPRQYEELCRASQHGPIVILNSHRDHCDAVVLLRPTSDPLHIPLSDVSIDKLRKTKLNLRDMIKGRNFRLTEDQIPRLVGRREGNLNFKELLNWIWTCIVNPIYLALEAVSSHLFFHPNPMFIIVFRMVSLQEGCGGVRLEISWPCLFMLQTPLIDLYNPTHQHWGLYWKEPLGNIQIMHYVLGSPV
jgi:hypothetical protein